MNDIWQLTDDLACGYFDCSIFGDSTVSPVRERTRFEIDYYLEDGRSTFSNNTEYKIRKGYVLIGRPGETCNSLLPFKTKFLKFPADGRIAELLRTAPTYFPVHRTYEAEQLLDEIIVLHTLGESTNLALCGKLMCLIALLLEDANTLCKASTPTTKAVADAKKFIDTHYSEPIRLADIASALSLSPSYCHAIFTSTCGITPHEYLTERRISAARELLCATSLPIGEIAERCGFSNQQYLGTVFKQHLGISPGNCRKEYRQKYLL
ncbi:MAG: helix-turn-helix transcriptional regulator [Clostridia bacterium]|nr:helix-turn-helix transcriptional regulator [Clostridia bacterium]